MDRLLRLSLTALFALGFAAGCGDATVPPAIDIGNGNAMFASLEDGDLLLVEEGAGGSYGVELALALVEFDPTGSTLEITGVDEETGQEVAVPFSRVLGSDDVVENDDGWRVDGAWLELVGSDLALIAGQRMLIEVTLRSADDVLSLSDSVAVLLGYPSLSIGRDVGGYEYTPYVEDDVADLYMGIQGGYHLLVAVHGDYFPSEDVLLNVTGTNLDSPSVLMLPVARVLSAQDVVEGPQDWTRFDLLMIALILDPADVIGDRLLLEATLTDPGSGLEVSQSVTVVVGDATP